MDKEKVKKIIQSGEISGRTENDETIVFSTEEKRKTLYSALASYFTSKQRSKQSKKKRQAIAREGGKKVSRRRRARDRKYFT